jgi:outer membrane protein assembly factor BamB
VAGYDGEVIAPTCISDPTSSAAKCIRSVFGDARRSDWEFDIAEPLGVAVGADDTIYVAGTLGDSCQLAALDGYGRQRWAVPLPGCLPAYAPLLTHAPPAPYTPPVVDGQGTIYLFVDGADRRLLAIDRGGAIRWSQVVGPPDQDGTHALSVAIGAKRTLYAVEGGKRVLAFGD